MTKLEELIVSKIEREGGIKATALVSDPEIVKLSEDIDHLFHTLDMLVKERKIIEIEYITKNMPQRVKSFYLSAGTCPTLSVEYDFLGEINEFQENNFDSEIIELRIV